MGAFGVIIHILHYIGLYVQLSFSSRQGGHVEVENSISGNAILRRPTARGFTLWLDYGNECKHINHFQEPLFTEVPHDIITQSGQDVEMACSFRGSGSPSYSLEIQWWYIRHHKDWTDKQAWMTNQVVPEDEMVTDATKISVVKVAGSNISHKLRLSSVKPADEGTYECRVIDFSDSKARHHRVRAYLQVEPEKTPPDVTHLEEGHPSALRQQPQSHDHQKEDRKLKKLSDGAPTDCTDSCVL